MGLDEKAYLEFVYNLQQNASLGFDVASILKRQLEQRTKACEFYGKVITFFILTSVMTLILGFKSFIFAHNPNQTIQMNLFSYMLPFVSFMIDASVKRAYCVNAKSVYQGLKVVFTFYFLCIYVISLQRKSNSKFYWLASSNLIIFPIVVTVYWWLLIRGSLS